VIGEFARTGWLAYPPLSEIAYSPGVGVDYYLWSLQISGLGTLLAGINFTTTILKLRAPGMSYSRMPIFCWTALASNLLIVAAFPILTATFAMLLLDRYLGFHFFTNDAGGNPMMYINLIWAWGHPEVYILILPAFGVFSEVIATFSGKPLFGHRSMVIATMAICMLSFMVWLHHFFTMGAGANVNAFFGIMTMIIAVPTGVKVFNWLFTLYWGEVRFTSPVYWSLGFMVTFVIGGMTGVLLAIPPADFVLHNSLFLVAHFHNVIIGGVVFGAMAGYTYWFPKAFGFTLDERLGKAAFWCWFIGFYLAFMPLYVLGLMGATRRMQHYTDTSWQPLMWVAFAGAIVILTGMAFTVAQLVYSIKTRDRRRDRSGDPWNGRTLEWSTASPPPPWNFTVMPQVSGIDEFWSMKRTGKKPSSGGARPPSIHVPRRSSLGFLTAFCAVIFGFSSIWHIGWLAILGLLGAIALTLKHSWQLDTEVQVSAQEIAEFETRHKAAP
jgi:cytochrome o ubiquinol oxidase subunit 1